MSQKTSFYRSEGRAFVSEVEESPLRRIYSGVERRRGNRRENVDRRAEVRFDLKGDRREGFGRRADDHQTRFW